MFALAETSLRHDAERLKNAVEEQQGDVILQLTSLSSQRVTRLLNFARTAHRIHKTSTSADELRILMNNISKSILLSLTTLSRFTACLTFLFFCVSAVEKLFLSAKRMANGNYEEQNLEEWHKNQSQVICFFNTNHSIGHFNLGNIFHSSFFSLSISWRN